MTVPWTAEAWQGNPQPPTPDLSEVVAEVTRGWGAEAAVVWVTAPAGGE